MNEQLCKIRRQVDNPFVYVESLQPDGLYVIAMLNLEFADNAKILIDNYKNRRIFVVVETIAPPPNPPKPR